MNVKYPIIISLLTLSCATSRKGKVVDSSMQNTLPHSNISLSNNNGYNKILWEPLDDEDEYIIEMKGENLNPINTYLDTTNSSKTPERNRNFNEVLKYYSDAQSFIYKKDYDSALYAIDASLEIMETPEGLALKGSILFLKGLYKDADYYWIKAKDNDPSIRIPKINR